MATKSPTYYARIVPPRDKKDPRPLNVLVQQLRLRFTRIQSRHWRETWYGVNAEQAAVLKTTADERGTKTFEVMTAAEWEAEALRQEQLLRRRARPMGPKQARSVRQFSPAGDAPAVDRSSMPIINVEEDENDDIADATTVEEDEAAADVEEAEAAAKTSASTKSSERRGRSRR